MAGSQPTVPHSASPADLLARLPGGEHRPQQIEMALAIGDVLTRGRHLVIEAPTGVGKTLAYLLPAVLHALRENRKAIVSTHTRNLQEQILRKDIPLTRTLVGIHFHASHLKGRRNYLCLTRLERVRATTRSLFDQEGSEQLERILQWSRTTTVGDVEDLPFQPRWDVWNEVCAEQGLCSSSHCTRECFFQRAKERARSSAVVILNHALFFNLLALQNSAEYFLFERDFVIFDEAHMLEPAAAAAMGRTVSSFQVTNAIHRLYNPATRKGLLHKQRKAQKELAAIAEERAREFFEEMRGTALALGTHTGAQKSPRLEIRMRTRSVVPDIVTGALRDLAAEAARIAESLEGGYRQQELLAAAGAVEEAGTGIGEFLEQPHPDFAYWVEISRSDDALVRLCTSPVDVAAVIGPMLSRTDTSVIMTSASLAVSGSLEYFKSRIGATAVPGKVLDSPFDFSRQMRVCIARDIPDPDHDAYTSSLPRWVLHAVDRSKGRALVLFTSAALMHEVAAAVEDALQERGIPLLVQGTGLSRHGLLEAFKRDIPSVLFGLESFWMGIDVPGEALEHVIMTKLPFSVPNHPLVEARMEAIAHRGGNAFAEYTLPEAVLRFRQGAGRLIRTHQDRGMVTILDHRVLSRPYGRIFISSLPRCPVELFDLHGDSQDLDIDAWYP